MQTSLQTVWDILTDYEGLADFIPGLAGSKLLEKRENFARVFQGVKSNAGELESDSVVGQEYQTTLRYVVNVKPKAWLPVRLVEGRICKDMKTNLSCIRQVAEKKAIQNANPALIQKICHRNSLVAAASAQN